MQKIYPCLCFKNNAAEAVEFYTSIFKNSKTTKTAYYGEDIAKAAGQKAGTVLSIEFDLENQHFMAINGPDFAYSPSLSFSVYCENEEEIDTLWKKLSQNGSVLMGLDKYPWSEKYGWCADQYGVSWQLIIAKGEQKIIPSFLFVNKLFGKGEEAIKFYTSIFSNSKIENIHHDPTTNTVMHGSFSLDGRNFVLMEGAGDEHKHSMTQAISMVVNCKTQKEIDYFWEKLSDGGEPNVCGWLQDKYGVSWQVVPELLGGLVASGDQRKTDNVMKAVMTMKKLDWEALKAAYEQS